VPHKSPGLIDAIAATTAATPLTRGSTCPASATSTFQASAPYSVRRKPGSSWWPSRGAPGTKACATLAEIYARALASGPSPRCASRWKSLGRGSTTGRSAQHRQSAPRRPLEQRRSRLGGAGPLNRAGPAP